MMSVTGILTALLLAYSRPVATVEVDAGLNPAVSAHFHFEPAGVSAPSGTVLLLPGQSGLSILGDDQHYNRAAARWQARCYDTLIVDYRPAWRAAGRPNVGEETGHKIAWVVDRAVEWLQASGRADGRPMVIAAWSLGGEGGWVLANRDDGDFAAGIFYYPANQDGLEIAPQIPLLILNGALDDVTPVAELPDLTAARPHSQIVVLNDSHHGFDVESLRQRRRLRLIPFIGPSATLQFNDAAAAAAIRLEDDFLTRIGLPDCTRRDDG